MEQIKQAETPTTGNSASVLLECDAGVAVITLNRSKSINALSEEMLAAMQDCFDSLADDRTVKAIILRSSSDHFCAGHNLKEMTLRRQDDDGGKGYFIELFETCSRLMKTIVNQPQPVIAEVRGIATAAGCQLVAACDLAVASDTARFATSGVNIGLFCSTPMVALSRNLSRKQSMEMLLMGEFLPAQRVCDMGLVNRVVPVAELEQTVLNYCEIIKQNAPLTIRAARTAINAAVQDESRRNEGLIQEMVEACFASNDYTEGYTAFMEKRKPAFQGQ